jgi:hypothetical protein
LHVFNVRLGSHLNLAWSCMSIIPVVKRLRQEDSKFWEQPGLHSETWCIKKGGRRKEGEREQKGKKMKGRKENHFYKNSALSTEMWFYMESFLNHVGIMTYFFRWLAELKIYGTCCQMNNHIEKEIKLSSMVCS